MLAEYSLFCEVGSWFAELLLMVVAIYRQQGRYLFDFLVAAWQAASRGILCNPRI
jgi:hypothetical protein